jgi:hypothetical protein
VEQNKVAHLHLFYTILEVLLRAIREEEEIKGNQIGKEVKLFLFADGMCLSIENISISNKKLLELTCGFGKISGHKINIQKSVAFLFQRSNYMKNKSRRQLYLE